MRAVVVGLGRLGAPLAAVLAAGGASVCGVDVNTAAVEAVNAGRSPVIEPGLDQLMVKAASNLTATTDYVSAVREAEISFVVVPTPSGADGTFSLTYVLEAVSSIGAALKHYGSIGHVVVITSTVMPGSTLGPVREALESSSGLTVGDDVGLCYSPEFIALGSVIKDLTNPDMILVGEANSRSGDALLAALELITSPGRPVARMDPTSAEVAKLAVNTFVTTKISYANMLGEICDRLPGSDADLVTSALGLDSRIGSKYLKPGAAFGGPCFPRDNLALAALARSLGVSADIAEATEAINRRQVDRLMTQISERVDWNRVAVLGLSYKPGTPVRDESFGVAVARSCFLAGRDVIAWDPLVTVGRMSDHLAGVALTDSLREALFQADVAVIATPWPELRSIGKLMAGEATRSMTIIDCWKLLAEGEQPAGSLVIRPGRPEGSENPLLSGR